MKIRFMMLAFVFCLCSNFMFVSAESVNPVITVDEDKLMPVPLQSIRLVVQPEYQCIGDIITNVTYTAYVVTSIPEGSKIDFYTGSPSNPYPTTLMGSSYVKDGKAVFRTYQRVGSYYLGSAVWTKSLIVDTKIPPTRVYSNIVTYRTAMSNKLIDLNVSVNNLSKTNVSYTAKFRDQASIIISDIIEPVESKQPESIDLAALQANGRQMKARFITYQIPAALDPIPIDSIAADKSLVQTLISYREDYADIKDWTANIKFDLPAGRYIVYVQCAELTTSTATTSYSVPRIPIIVIPPIDVTKKTIATPPPIDITIL